MRGGNILEGEIEVSGSKNAALVAMPASLLFKGKIDFLNLPEIEDIKRMRELLSGIEAKGEIDLDIAKRFRASILTVGPALARFGKAVFPHPGGCVIGARPIDVFLEGWENMGAEIEAAGQTAHGTEVYNIKAPHGLRGCDHTLRVPSVTGTAGLIMTAVLARGTTVLRNAAMEPEIAYLEEFLNRNGAKITGAGTHTVIVEGREGELLIPKEPFIDPPDRIEAGSFAILGALAAKKLKIKNCNTHEISSLLSVLQNAGAYLETGTNYIVVGKSEHLNAVDVKTQVYPGFATDLQAPFMVLLTQAEGQGLIHETIFEGRLNHIEDLNRMGAKIALCDPHRAIVSGPSKLRGKVLESPDLRAGLAYVMAALVAEGESQIGNIYQIDRGYERIDTRLRSLGADIERI